jgi:hypothetical protein
MSFQLPDSYQTTLRVGFSTKKGNPTLPKTKPVWAVSDPTKLTIHPSDDGLSALIVAVGPLGLSHVTATSDTVTTTFDVDVIPSEPTSAVIAADSPNQVLPPPVPPSPPAPPAPSATPMA